MTSLRDNGSFCSFHSFLEFYFNVEFLFHSSGSVGQTFLILKCRLTEIKQSGLDRKKYFDLFEISQSDDFTNSMEY